MANRSKYVCNSYNIMLSDHSGRQTFNRHLLHCILNQNKRIVKFLPKIDKKFDIGNLVDVSGRTLLHYAVEYKHLAISNKLINLGCNIHAADNLGQTPFLLGLKTKDERIISMLAHRVTEVYIDEDIGRTWLRTILADPKLSRHIPRLLLSKMKVKSGNNTELANILIAEKCELCYAIYAGNSDVIKIMIDQGCSIDAKDVEGCTALHLAVRLRQLDNVKLLLERGADVNAQNNKRQIPINYPKFIYNTAEHRKILKLLVDNGCQVTLLDDTNRMQIYGVLCNGPKEAVEILLNSNIDFLAQDASKKTILHYLVTNRNPGVVELLNSRNIDANIRDEKGRTPLHVAAKVKNEIACKVLLDKGADINIMSGTHTAVPLFYAMKGEEYTADYTKCVELLLERGADAQFVNNGLTIFNLPQSYNFSKLSGIFIGHFALFETLGKTITERIRREIEANEFYKTKYDLCKQWLEKLKKDLIYEGISLFNLLTEKENKVVGYMRNIYLRSAVENYNCRYHFNSYINMQIHKRVDNALQLAYLSQRAVYAMKELMNSNVGTDSVILSEIISYLDRQDLRVITNVLFN